MLRIRDPARWRGGFSRVHALFHPSARPSRTAQAPHTTARASLLLFLMYMLSAAGRGSAQNADELARHVQEAAHEIRDLEELYRESDDARERKAALQTILKHGVWLEQVAGSGAARGSQLLALARLKVLEGDPLRYGFLDDAAGSTTLEVVLRQATPAELPEAFQELAHRLHFISVENHSSQPYDISQGLLAEQRDLVGKLQRIPMAHEKDLPPEALARATLFAWPPRLESGEKFQRIVLFPKARGTLVAIVMPVHDPNGADPRPRDLRIDFPEISAPDDFRAALRDAAQELITLKQEHEKKRKRAEAQKPVAPDPKPPRTDQPQPRKPPRPDVPAPEIIPPRPKPNQADPTLLLPALGTVHRSGNREKVLVRMHLGVRVAPEEIFSVRKDERWTGRIRMQKTLVGMALSGQDCIEYWAHVYDGTPEQLIGGTLHREQTRPPK